MSGDWESVGLFVSPEVGEALVYLEGVGSARRRWYSIPASGKRELIAICGLYARSNDVDVWHDLIEDWLRIKETDAIRCTILAGHCNFHLQGFMDHQSSCKCSHCLSPSADRKVSLLLASHGFVCVSPRGLPTHVSGTAVDMLFTDAPWVISGAAVLPWPRVRRHLCRSCCRLPNWIRQGHVDVFRRLGPRAYSHRGWIG